MHWKENRRVEQLFSLPGRKMRAKSIAQDFKDNLIAQSQEEERFDDLFGDNQDQEKLSLENVIDNKAKFNNCQKRKEEFRSLLSKKNN